MTLLLAWALGAFLGWAFIYGANRKPSLRRIGQQGPDSTRLAPSASAPARGTFLPSRDNEAADDGLAVNP